MSDGTLKIADQSFNSRLFVGTGKFESGEILSQVIEYSETEMVTVAMKRANPKDEARDSIMHFIENATQGEKFVLQKFLKKRYDSISEEEITFWLDEMRAKGVLDLSLSHLKKVSERAINISSKTDDKLFQIVSFVISSIIKRITRNIKNFK